MRSLILVVAVALSGCVHYMPAAVSSSPIGSKYEKPIGVTTGISRAYYILGAGPIGNDSLNAALEDAVSEKREADTMGNVFVDRRLICFPLCAFPLFLRIDTMITGTLIDYLEFNTDLERVDDVADFFSARKKGEIVVIRTKDGEQFRGKFIENYPTAGRASVQLQTGADPVPFVYREISRASLEEPQAPPVPAPRPDLRRGLK